MSSPTPVPSRDFTRSEPGSNRSTRPTRVLVVDDDRAVREALAEVLAANGYVAVEARTGSEALGFLERDESIDLVLLDMNMPEPDGFDVLRRLKERDGRRDVPVICLSARSAVEDRVAGLRLGAVDYLAKPFDLRELFVRMARPLRVSRALERLDRARTAAERLSLTDPLTGLPNRRELEQRLKEELLRSQRTREPLGCIMLDVDRFKLINDRFGHLVGDAALAEVASAVAAALRASDVIARFGGDEFAVLLPGANLEGTRRLAETLTAVVTKLDVPSELRDLCLTISAGAVSHDPATSETAEALLERADAALLEAKRTGRNRVVAHGPAH